MGFANLFFPKSKCRRGQNSCAGANELDREATERFTAVDTNEVAVDIA